MRKTDTALTTIEKVIRDNGPGNALEQGMSVVQYFGWWIESEMRNWIRRHLNPKTFDPRILKIEFRPKRYA
jgi:hypothetical protein